MGLMRGKHWDTRGFHAFLLKRHAPFAWGTNDCCTFVADAVRAVTGVAIDEDFRGNYSSEEEAFALIHSVTGGDTVADAMAWCAAKHGLTERPHPLKASRGEMVVVENGGKLIAGVVHLNGRHVVAMAEAGPVRLPIRSVVRAWSF